MKCYAFFVTLFLYSTLTAQRKTEAFELKMPQEKIAGSLYNSIQLLDARRDTSNMGVVQVGAFNAKARVVPKTNFQQQLNNVLDSLTDSTAGSGMLLLQLRQFSMAEVTGSMSEKGYCFLRANLYKATGNQYTLIGMTDTLISFGAMDVTQKLLRKGSEAITGFIAGNLTNATGPVYNYQDIAAIDSIEKAGIKVFAAAQYEEGAYNTYQAFKNQLPDFKEITVKEDKAGIASVKVKLEDGTTERLKSKEIYAVVYKGKPYIATGYGYYPLEKKGNDFLFTGKAAVTASTGDVMVASFFFGIIGGLLASDASATFEMKIDHINGGFIHLRELKSVSQ